jgi:predicted ester cyclase
MSAAETEALLREYLDVLLAGGDFGQYFADDIVVTLEDTGQVVNGKDPAVQAITDLHRVAFTATPEFGSLVAGPGAAALEAVFVGTHTGEFAGMAATNRPVRVPYVVFYEIADGKIEALRLYGLAAGLLLQVSGQLPVATPTG